MRLCSKPAQNSAWVLVDVQRLLLGLSTLNISCQNQMDYDHPKTVPEICLTGQKMERWAGENMHARNQNSGPHVCPMHIDWPLMV